MKSNNVISTLGTLHDLFLTNPNYGLNQFISALYQYKPEVILSEVLVERPTSGDASIDGGIEQSIVLINNLKKSESLLETHLNSKIYQSEMHEKLRLKMPRFESWIVAVSKM